VQIRDWDWADPRETASPEDLVEEVEYPLPSRLTSLRRRRRPASSSADPRRLAALEYASEEADGMLDIVDDPRPPSE